MTPNVTCASFPCTVTIVLTAPEAVVVHAASVGHKKRKSKTLTLGKGTITTKTEGGKKLTFKLAGAAHGTLNGKKGHIRVSALISTQIEHHKTKVTKTLTLTVKAEREEVSWGAVLSKKGTRTVARLVEVAPANTSPRLRRGMSGCP